MKISRQQWNLGEGGVWAGRYKNSQNLPHWHYNCELFTVDKGALDVMCNGTVYRVESGQSFFIDSGLVHYTHALSPDTEITMIVFDYGIIKPFAAGLALEIPIISADYGLHALYDEVMGEIKSRKPLYSYRAAIDVAKCMTDIYRGERTCPSDAKDGRTDRLKALMSDIDENYADYDLTAAAKFMNMNSSYFSRLFHAVTGISFNRYLTYVRCANAVNMIKSDKDLTMTEIALACGFTTIRNFNRIFRAYTGYAPTRLPDGYVMQENFIPVSASENNPTLNECILLERSDG